MKFEFQKFEEEMCNLYSGKLDRNIITDLLDLGEEYDKDKPLSTGKRLIITHLSFKGEKQSDGSNDYSGNLINYSCSVGTGVNIWVADNLKGKSSIFKIIKYALTGSNSLKTNIKSWISEIILNFSIGEERYTVFMNTKKRLRAYLLSDTYKNADEVYNAEGEYLIEAKSESDYTDKIQDFFFEQFSYYSLRWTQKHSGKDKNELLEVGASWSTYFTSMLLESKDSDNLYGAQGKKIIEMLLGLELTYPINRLKVKSDLLKDEMSKEMLYNQRQDQNATDNIESLRQKMIEIDRKLAALEVEANRQWNISDLIDQYNDKIDKISKNRVLISSTETKLQQTLNEIEGIRSRQQISQNERGRIKSEIQKVTRSINDLKEYLEIGIFFSNLEITQCPSCSHKIPESRRMEVGTTHKCYVCQDSIMDDDLNDDPSSFQEKILTNESLLIEYQHEEKKLIAECEQFVVKLQDKSSEIQILQNELKAIPDTKYLVDQLAYIEVRINEAKINKANEEQRIKLMADHAILDYQIKQLAVSSNSVVGGNKIAAKIEMLDMAVSVLTEKRYSIGREVVNRLSTLMLAELHELGLTSISDIQITDKLDILYKQDGELMNFSSIVEGEQLRAKIAFYLSLIQLDIEFNFGRHTRLLIIDSPGKEEADKKYLDGFSSIIKSIQERFGNNLQILIGTAQRELIDVVPQQYVTPPLTFVF